MRATSVMGLQVDGPGGLSYSLGYFGPARNSGGFEIDAHATTQRGRDVDQRVEREARDPAAEQIVDAWLGNAAAAPGLRLGPLVFFQAWRGLPHPFCPRSPHRS